jgi:hypothetical protein
MFKLIQYISIVAGAVSGCIFIQALPKELGQNEILELCSIKLTPSPYPCNNIIVGGKKNQ